MTDQTAPVRPKLRCGHCGRFVSDGPLIEFGEHIDCSCPVGGTFNPNGVLRGRKAHDSTHGGTR